MHHHSEGSSNETPNIRLDDNETEKNKDGSELIRKNITHLPALQSDEVRDINEMSQSYKIDCFSIMMAEIKENQVKHDAELEKRVDEKLAVVSEKVNEKIDKFR